MAWNPVPAKLSGDIFDLATYNIIRANDAASAPGIVAVKGDLVAATAANAIARLAVGADDSTLVPDTTQVTGLAWQIQPAVRVYNDVDIDPATSNWVDLTFNTERFDTDGMHSTVSNTSRLTVPAGGAGLYLIGGQVEFDDEDSGAGSYARGLKIRLNAATELASVREDANAPAAGRGNSRVEISTLYSLAVGDYVELQVYTSRNINVKANGNISPEFWAIWQRRA
jgi:hypothetical protein